MKTDHYDNWETNEESLYSEINITPFIDVILVLLIVFMVTAPLATSILPVQLPTFTQAPVADQTDKPLYITLQKNHILYIGKNQTDKTEFVDLLLQETQRNFETKILIRADSEIDYGAVVDLLNQIRMVGYTKIGLVGLQKTEKISHSNVISDSFEDDD
ncbi:MULTISPECIES: biopolymer transporter ExbD [unclassified Bartonella]|uniref:biopolymer transporter ExbD n=1 Tax=unclassified Bartonella TaxID=2645622 RepID=UPI0009992589|nr:MULTISPECIES: biopolymer transporter ExbD [unclassified Bartonella]AQX28439.1 biopolymer transport protein ExbD [Bartonella sp. JB15]AQX29705.1 biopolymer transport protein ExbD [Bartonella sp. JB63]